MVGGGGSAARVAHGGRWQGPSQQGVAPFLPWLPVKGRISGQVG